MGSPRFSSPSSRLVGPPSPSPGSAPKKDSSMLERLVKISRLLLSACVICATTSIPQADAAAPMPDWKQDFWNPRPESDDVVLPLPCGGGVAFRRILTTVSGNWLADEPLQLGNSDIPGQEHSESILRDSIVGSLTIDEKPSDRFYLLGKYELTRDQYDAVMKDECPSPSDGGSLPVDEISWFDANRFAQRLTSWLYKEAPGALKSVAGEKAFVRLPTEEEWEFAARGGLTITDADRRKLRFPMDGSLSDYVWFAGFKSCDGSLQPVGLLEPNPLGLYDILGNAQELTSDFYRLRTRSRPHGQVGGATARGGSCLTSEERVRTAEREEIPLYDAETGEARGRPFTGLRLAIGAPVLAGHDRIETINRDWKAIGDTRVTIDPDRDPIDTLGEIAAAETSDEIRGAIEDAVRVFRTEMEQRNRIELRSAKLVVLSGGLGIRDYILGLDTNTRIARLLESADADQLTMLRENLNRGEERLAVSRQIFLSALVHAADDFPQETLESARQIVTEENRLQLREMTERTQQTTQEMIDMFVEFSETYRKRPDTPPEYFEGEIKKLFQKFREGIR
ncbi:MAG: SUMF1/EgtB/PvdO family nonheme iron enzyme [Pseudomonadota bacterium]|nr:SUMF1/EgtB/PvdO family nonheme iron enzyme [Pseudomonadota bacterium]